MIRFLKTIELCKRDIKTIACASMYGAFVDPDTTSSWKKKFNRLSGDKFLRVLRSIPVAYIARVDDSLDHRELKAISLSITPYDPIRENMVFGIASYDRLRYYWVVVPQAPIAIMNWIRGLHYPEFIIPKNMDRGSDGLVISH